MQKSITILYNNDSSGVYSSLPVWHEDELFTQRHILHSQLAEQGIELSLVRITFPDATKPAQILRATHPVFHEDGLLDIAKTSFEPFVLSDIRGVIIDRIGLERLKQHNVTLPDSELPVLNHYSIQQLGHKQKTYDNLLAPFGWGIPTFDLQKLDPADMPDELISAAGGIFVKPAEGRLSLGITYFETYQSFENHFASLGEKLTGDYVVQPEYFFGHPWPEVLPFSPDDSEKLLHSNVPNIHKELRVYCFYDADANQKAQCFPIGRVAVEGEDFMYGCDRFFIDPSSCPPQLKKTTTAIADTAAQITDQRAFFIAVDFGYGGPSPTSPPAWEVIEVNTYSPYIGFMSQHDGIGEAIQALQTEHLVHLTKINS